MFCANIQQITLHTGQVLFFRLRVEVSSMPAVFSNVVVKEHGLYRQGNSDLAAVASCKKAKTLWVLVLTTEFARIANDRPNCNGN